MGVRGYIIRNVDCLLKPRGRRKTIIKKKPPLCEFWLIESIKTKNKTEIKYIDFGLV